MYTITDIKKILKNTNFEILEWNGVSKNSIFRSKVCGHTLEILWRNLQRKIKNESFLCTECAHYGIGDTNRFNPEDINLFVSSSTGKEYKLLDAKNYRNTKSKIRILHKTCNRSYSVTYDNFRNGRRCPYCARMTQESKAAQLLKRILNHLNVKFVEEKVYDDCINPFTQKQLRFDLYLVDKNILIEIDGEQHYVPIYRFGGQSGLEETQYRDFLKNKYCYENNINLIRISLYDKKLQKKKSYEEVKLEVFHFLNKYL